MFAPDAAQNFDDLKRDMLSLFKEVENSILFSPKLAKVLSIATHNLSRFNDNELFFHEATAAAAFAAPWGTGAHAVFALH